MFLTIHNNIVLLHNFLITMVIDYDKNKNCSAYKDLVLNPEDRTSIKKFNKMFNSTLISAAVKIHNKMISATNASIYNLTAASDNKIELVSGTPNKSCLKLKVRIQQGYRKLFYYDKNSKDFCLQNEWTGQFDAITSIYVYDVNKHNYKK